MKQSGCTIKPYIEQLRHYKQFFHTPTGTFALLLFNPTSMKIIYMNKLNYLAVDFSHALFITDEYVFDYDNM